MLRSGKTLLKKTVVAAGIDLTLLQNAICVQQARHLRPRKPAYSGMAKSKLFRIPKRPEFLPDELAEIRRISNQYRLYMRSISHFFKLEKESHAAGSKEAEKEVEAQEADWHESLLRINQWNDEVALKRNERLANERKAREEEIRERILLEERNEIQRIQDIDDIVRKEKERSLSYITADNIDEAIERALEDNLDYNYAIDVWGKKYIGRYVNASGIEELPKSEVSDEDSMPSLFQSAPLSSGFATK